MDERKSPQEAAAAAREAKLAEALRANLRRRKQVARGQPAKSPPPPDGAD